MRRFAIALAALVFTALYFTPNADAFGRHRRGGNECGCESCGCGENCDCERGRRHRRHEECCNHSYGWGCGGCVGNYGGCVGNYGCGGGCVGYVPVMVYRPVTYYSSCLGCTGMYAGGCVGHQGVGFAGAPTMNNSGGHWEWKPNQHRMPGPGENLNEQEKKEWNQGKPKDDKDRKDRREDGV